MSQDISVTQMRTTALKVARAFFKVHQIDPMKCSAEDALSALDVVSQDHPTFLASRWYRSANSVQIAHFYIEWQAWQRGSFRLPHS